MYVGGTRFVLHSRARQPGKAACLSQQILLCKILDQLHVQARVSGRIWDPCVTPLAACTSIWRSFQHIPLSTSVAPLTENGNGRIYLSSEWYANDAS